MEILFSPKLVERAKEARARKDEMAALEDQQRRQEIAAIAQADMEARMQANSSSMPTGHADWYAGYVGEARGPKNETLVSIGETVKNILPSIGSAIEKIGWGNDTLSPEEYALAAIEGATLVPPAAATGKVAGQVARTAEIAMRPPAKNRLYGKMPWSPEHAAGSIEQPWVQRNIFSPEEWVDMEASGYFRPSPKMQDQGRFDKFWTLTNSPSGHVRIPSERVPVGRSASIKDAQIRDPKTGQYVPYQKGLAKELGYIQ